MPEEKQIQLNKNYNGISSQVYETRYNKETKQMTVVFNIGATWAYSPVPLEVWEASLKAQSIGKFLNSEIKPKYEAYKLN